MDFTRLNRRAAVSAVLVLAWFCPARAADWTRTFNDGTTKDQRGVALVNQPLPGVPAGEFTFSVVSSPSSQDRSLRLKFAGGGSDGDSGVLLDHDDVFIGQVSAKMLIRYSQNPILAVTPTNSEINAGFILHVQADFQSYICVMDDRGYLQLQEVLPGLDIAAFPGGSKSLDDYYATPGFFKPDKDWWIRFEVLPMPPDSVHLRARAWQDGTPEPECTWIVEASDSVTPLFGGATAIVANEDASLPNGQNYLDIDNASVSAAITCVEVCGNGLDDDQDGNTDCDDSDCDLHASCACNAPFADFDGDQDVDQADFAQFQLCFTGAGDQTHVFNKAACDCFDRDEMNGDSHFARRTDGDNDIDAVDLDAFIKCVSGPDIPANPNCAG